MVNFFSRLKYFIRKTIAVGGLLFLVGLAPVALAALTLSSLTITSDGALNLTGSGASTWDIGTGILSIQNTNNGAVAFGTGTVTSNSFFSTSSTISTLNGNVALNGNLDVFGVASSTSFRTASATISTLSGAVTITNSGSLTVYGVASSTQLRTPSATLATINGYITIQNGGLNVASATLATVNGVTTFASDTTANNFRSTSGTISTLSGAVTIDNSGSLTVYGIVSSTQALLASSTISKLTVAVSGTPILSHLSATASLNFGTLGTSTCGELPVTVTGALAGDTIVLGPPNTNIATGTLWSAWASTTASAVQVRLCNVGVNSAANGAGTWRVDIWRH